MKCKKLALAAASLLTISSTASIAATWDTHTLGNQNYSGSVARTYEVYEPDGLSGPAPMIMVLHGCSQTEEDVKNDWGFKSLADSQGFILVTPFITSYDGQRNQNCWGFWFNQHTHEGMGEPEDLYQIAQEVIADSDYNVDTDKVYITGLSSGGAMTVIAAVTHNEFWTAAAPVAGLPYGETSSSVNLSGCTYIGGTFQSVTTIKNNMAKEMDDDYQIPILVMGNDADCTVPHQNFLNIRDSFKELYGAVKVSGSNPSCDSYDIDEGGSGSSYDYFNASGTGGSFSGCTVERYTDTGSSSESLLVLAVHDTGPEISSNHKHYQQGVTYHNPTKWAVNGGIKMAKLSYDFFMLHDRNGAGESPNGNPVVIVEGDNPTRIDEGDTFTDEGVTVIDPEDENDTESASAPIDVSTDCSSVDTNNEGTYDCTYTVTDSDSNEKEVVRVVEVDDTATSDDCTGTSATMSAHYTAGRMTKVSSSYYDDNSRWLGISPATDSVSVTLYQAGDGSWVADQPDSCLGGTPSAPTGGLYCGSAKISAHIAAGRIYNSHVLYADYCKVKGTDESSHASYPAYDCDKMVAPSGYPSWGAGDPSVTIQETSEGYYDRVTSCP